MIPKLSRRDIMVAVVGAGAVAGGATVLRAFQGGRQALASSPVFAVKGIAIRGADPVAYFRDGGPTPGKKDFQTKWNGAIWRFASAANRDAFIAEPTRFAPQYGGYCAWAVAAKGELYSIQPRNWAIVEQRLFLNYNDAIQKLWQKDIPGFIAKADLRWPKIIKSA